jgi:hypothetical protein
MEFQIHDRVNELLKLLGGQSNSKEHALNFSDYLDKNRHVFNQAAVPMHQARQKIALNCTNSEEFVQKYDELKLKNNRDLDVFTFFISEIVDKPELKSLVANKEVKLIILYFFK